MLTFLLITQWGWDQQDCVLGCHWASFPVALLGLLHASTSQSFQALLELACNFLQLTDSCKVFIYRPWRGHFYIHNSSLVIHQVDITDTLPNNNLKREWLHAAQTVSSWCDERLDIVYLILWLAFWMVMGIMTLRSCSEHSTPSTHIWSQGRPAHLSPKVSRWPQIHLCKTRDTLWEGSRCCTSTHHA